MGSIPTFGTNHPHSTRYPGCLRDYSDVVPVTKQERKDPTLIGALVAATRAELIRAGGCPLDMHTWKRAMGERIAARSQPDQLRDGILTLTVASSVWAQELTLLSSTIVARLRELGFTITRIRCKVGRLDADSTPTPLTRPRVAVPPPVELPPELTQRLANIEDVDLKASIESAARAQLSLQDRRREAKRRIHAPAKGVPRRR